MNANNMSATVPSTFLGDTNLFAPVTFPQSVHWSLQSEKTFLMSTPKCLGVQIWQMKCSGRPLPPLQTAREWSALFTGLCSQ